ncbi:MAG: TetR/AcrR family transcriptional regulator [Ktedonobacteraceae bacterium]
MARVVKEEEYVVKRNEILAVAQRLVYTKGYEQMTIQDMLDDLQISKGAFYHYFGSKQELLEALIEGMLNEMEKLFIPIVHDAHLSALEKFQSFFDTLARWKTAQKTFLLTLLRVWFADDNAIVRQKVRAMVLKHLTPLLAVIISQGVQEGVMTTSYPDQVGEVIMSLLQDLSDTLGRLLLSFEPSSDAWHHVKSTVGAYIDALERILGASTGSLPFVDDKTLKEWFDAAGDNA